MFLPPFGPPGPNPLNTPNDLRSLRPFPFFTESCSIVSQDPLDASRKQEVLELRPTYSVSEFLEGFL